MHLNFVNHFASLPEVFYTSQAAEPFTHPATLVHFNPAASKLLDMHPACAQHASFIDYFSGAAPLPGSVPLASVYSGHQFGQYVPQLGDGRALLLGQVKNSSGELWEVQLKGSGRTPYSRFGDGRAVLRSTIREYLCSEAMHALHIPTTRALCILSSEEPVQRETTETAAMLTRLAPSHIRFGHFEYFFHTDQHQYIATLADFVIEHHFPHLTALPDKYQRFYYEVVKRTAHLIAHWQAVGFAHGVMNTDNMSILGFTLDYGPFGFMEHFDPGFICNHSDTTGRYAFDQQPSIAMWNLSRLAVAISPLISPDDLQTIITAFEPTLVQHYLKLMREKLGLREAQEEDMRLLHDLMLILQSEQLDYTLFFRELAQFDSTSISQAIYGIQQKPDSFKAWNKRYAARLKKEHSLDDLRRARMQRVNPKYILRNYMAEEVIRQATYLNDYSGVAALLYLLQHPYDEHPEFEKYAGESPSWAQDICVSCSS